MNAHTTSPWYNAEPVVTDDAFYPGDVVHLIIGGPHMVVIAACHECGEVEVRYINGEGDIHSDVVPEEALVHWDGSDD